ncbi:tryptophan 2,3-dioxygenase family protein [Streptomyces sp. NBC_00536]|uniref:tryptophan 2,3-dioxygenase n=1 Tax=Streptomyces sp. NBC_00536 TaxID=2975769 RepID=UPI002E823D07|nr:tryptophan 2,3-dioxygenase family protein [Streptomyces sp. NBC_00536]WUC79609.1 tryptophan 2,3-dioxygenase family protein [Streptomyces sp. NBC_00536]
MEHPSDLTMESGDGGNPFTRYVGSDVLLSLQNLRTDSETEPSFLITTQVNELLFKLAHTEAVRARNQLEDDDVAGALRTLRRLRNVYTALNGSWDVLCSLGPTEYGEFREALGEGSGFQSYMYRHMEFLLGHKVAMMAEGHRGHEPTYRELLRSLGEMSLYDAVLRLLWRRGLPVPQSSVERDWSEAVPPLREEIVEVWRTVYTDQGKYADLYLLAEALVDVAFDLCRWRTTHLLSVERLLGSKTGTAGSSGANWLRRVAEQRFFPELWAVRAQL